MASDVTSAISLDRRLSRACLASTGTKMYDVRLYWSDLVLLLAGPFYLSQSTGTVTVTDHCGLGVQVELK